jgi:hypothetical protein
MLLDSFKVAHWPMSTARHCEIIVKLTMIIDHAAVLQMKLVWKTGYTKIIFYFFRLDKSIGIRPFDPGRP